MVSTPRKRSIATSPAEEATAKLISTFKALRKNWPIVVACVVFGVGVSFFYSKSVPRVYEASALIELNSSIVRPLGEKSDGLMPMGASYFWDNQEYYETQYKIVTSQRVLAAVVRDLNLASDNDFLGLRRPPANPLSPNEVALILKSRVKVEPIKNSRLFFLRVEDTNPARAKQICEAIATTYVDQNLQTAISATSDAVVWLNGQLDSVRQELEASENELHRFKKLNDLPSTSINEASNMVRLEMQEFDTALSRTRTRKQELLARHAELAKIAEGNVDELPASELLTNEYLQALRADHLRAVKERKELLGSGKGENHPLVKAADEKIAEARAALLAEVKNIKGAVARDLAVIERQEAGEVALYEAARRRAVDLNMKEIEYRRLDRSREQNEKLYSLLLERTKEADLARMMRVNNINIVDKPIQPTYPIRPRLALNLSLGLVAGLAIGALFAWLKEVLDSSIKTPDDVEKTLGLTFLGLLPVVDGQDKARRGRRNPLVASPGTSPELVVHSQPMSGIAEAARSVRTNIMFMSPDRPYRTLLVTSAAPAEGKTTVTCSIAIALAQGGQRVCIVDCDLRRPRLHRIFGRVGDAGLTNLLLGDADLEDVARPTEVENLWCIPSGPVPPNPADMLHSERFKKVLAELAERFDRVILDSPPLVAVTDSAIISTLVDGTVFVIRAFKTTRTLARQGLRTLADVDAPVVGTVLNAVNFSRHEYNYYHYYYKREGYGSIISEEPPTAAVMPPN